MHWRGELLHIHIAPQASAPMEGVNAARLIAGRGLEGDRYATHFGTYSKNHHIDRQATLIEVEVLEALARDRGIELAPHEHRRNLTTRGVPLNHLVGQYFRIGECVFYGGRLNIPCIYLENLLAKKSFQAAAESIRSQLPNHRRRNHPRSRPDPVVRSEFVGSLPTLIERSNSVATSTGSVTGLQTAPSGSF
jgi:hypothetical protein